MITAKWQNIAGSKKSLLAGVSCEVKNSQVVVTKVPNLDQKYQFFHVTTVNH